MFQQEVRRRIAEEFQRAQDARSQGLEGRARVCARRAAGEAARAYLQARGTPARGPSAYDLLAQIGAMQDLGPQVHQACARLLERVNEAFTLPAGVDLLVEARRLVDELERRSEQFDTDKRG